MITHEAARQRRLGPFRGFAIAGPPLLAFWVGLAVAIVRVVAA